ncbi:MAG: ATP-binding cassette domain-containing protein [Bacilli bacterium]|nr:ATP-binding cassette domain-containing protein [Bacilli bacterium]
MCYISVKNLSITFNKNKLFKDVSFNINKSSLVALTTPSSKGKTTLLNIINGNIPCDNILINNKTISDKTKTKITLITANVNYYSKTVLEELTLISNNILKIKKYLKEFKLIDYINMSPYELNYIQMQKLNLIKALLNKSEIILIDNIFCYFDKYSKLEYIGLLKKYQIDKGKTIIFTTTNLEDAIFSDKIIIIDKEVLYDGSIEKIYLNDQIIKKSKLNIPLENELLEKLKLYDVIDKVTYTIEEVVDEICK